MNKVLLLKQGNSQRLILDSCILINFFDEHQSAKPFNNLLEQAIDENKYLFYMPTVILTEIFKHFHALISNGLIATDILDKIQHFIMSNFIIVALDIEEAIISANLKHVYSSSPRPLPYNDCFIAATAQNLNAILVTDDGEFFKDKTVKDTSRIDQLTILSSEAFLRKSLL